MSTPGGVAIKWIFQAHRHPFTSVASKHLSSERCGSEHQSPIIIRQICRGGSIRSANDLSAGSSKNRHTGARTDFGVSYERVCPETRLEITYAQSCETTAPSVHLTTANASVTCRARSRPSPRAALPARLSERADGRPEKPVEGTCNVVTFTTPRPRLRKRPQPIWFQDVRPPNGLLLRRRI